eukprot:3712854-Rhodomonas_salina.1
MTDVEAWALRRIFKVEPEVFSLSPIRCRVSHPVAVRQSRMYIVRAVMFANGTKNMDCRFRISRVEQQNERRDLS